MSGDFFDPTPDQQVVVLVECATLRRAERLIESCEHCNEEGAQIPFDNRSMYFMQGNALLTIRTGSHEFAAVLGDMVFQAGEGSDRLKASLLSGFFKFVEPSSRRLGPDLCDP